MPIEVANKQEAMELLKATADNEEARQAFAASLALPIGKPIAEQSSVREIFAVHELEPGQIPVYPKHFGQVNAIILPRLGEVPQNLIVGDEITVPTFEVGNSIEWKISYARDGRFDIIESAIEQCKESIVRIEEEEGWNTLRAACTAGNGNVIQATNTTVTKKLLNALITKMRNYGYNPQTIYLNANRASDIRDWTNTTIDPTTQREIFQAGGLGNIWSVGMKELRKLSDTEIYLIDNTRLGVMPIRQTLTTYDLTDSAMLKRMRHGFMAWEEIGFAVMDVKAIIKVELNQGGGTTY